MEKQQKSVRRFLILNISSLFIPLLLFAFPVHAADKPHEAFYRHLSNLSDVVGTAHYHRFCEAALSEFDGFPRRIPVLKGMNNRRNFYSNGPGMLSNYLALRGVFGLGRSAALEKLRLITNVKHRKKFVVPPFMLRYIFKKVAGSRIVRRLFLMGFRHDTDEPYRWEASEVDSDAYIAVDYTRCGLVDWFRDMGAPEIAPIACEGDYIQFAGLQGLRFERSGTLAQGNSVCHMRFVRI